MAESVQLPFLPNYIQLHQEGFPVLQAALSLSRCLLNPAPREGKSCLPPLTLCHCCTASLKLSVTVTEGQVRRSHEIKAERCSTYRALMSAMLEFLIVKFCSLFPNCSTFFITYCYVQLKGDIFLLV